ncbi:MAG: hypothetical protein U0575_08660 [Phycisphaerales bacterium]
MRLPSRRLFACILAAAATASSTATGGPPDMIPCGYEVTQLDGPFVPGWGPTNLNLYDLNDVGVAVGSFSLLDPYPCTWSEAEGVKPIALPPGVQSGTAVRINNNGWILVNAEVAAYGDRGFVLMPNGAGYTWIPMIPPTPNGTGWSYVNGINDKNQVVGTESVDTQSSPPIYPFGGFQWSLEIGRVAIQIEGWNTTSCTDINDAGLICGNVSQTQVADPFTEDVRAFVLVGASAVVIEPPPPFTKSEARKVNASGTIAGNVRTEPTPDIPWSETAGFTYSLGEGRLNIIEPPVGHARWWIVDLNNSGVAIGTTNLTTTSWIGPPCAAADGVCVDLSATFPVPFNTKARDGLAITSDGTLLTDCSTKCTLRAKPVVHAADLDCDGLVGAADLALLISMWGSGDSADLDGDGVVAGGDLGLLLQAWSS